MVLACGSTLVPSTASRQLQHYLELPNASPRGASQRYERNHYFRIPLNHAEEAAELGDFRPNPAFPFTTANVRNRFSASWLRSGTVVFGDLCT